MKITGRRMVVATIIAFVLYIPLVTVVIWRAFPPRDSFERNTNELLSELGAEGIAFTADVNHMAQLVTNNGELICEPVVVGFAPPAGAMNGFELSAKRGIPIIVHFTGVRQLLLFRQSVGRELTMLAQLPKLEFLSLRDCEVALNSWSFLARLDALKNLTITSSNLGDEDLRTMRTPTCLVTLNLSYNAHVTHQGVRFLSPVESLSALSLSETSVSNLDFAQPMRGLRELDLMGTEIKDDDLDSLVTLPKLRVLNLGHTSITDNAVDYVLQMKALRHVDLTSTGVTSDGISRLKDRLPDLELLW